MQFLINNPFQHKASITAKIKIHSALLIGLSAVFSSSLHASTLTEYTAEYNVLRKGKIHGTATREFLQVADNTYALSYETDVKWMIFTEKRTEQSLFKFENGQTKPLHYSLNREGTRPDKSFKIKFDRDNKQLFSKEQSYPLKVEWDESRQDVLSYQNQLRNELKQGKTQFSYPIIDKNGNVRMYNFKVVGEETITLPIGNVKTVKVKRLYDNNKRHALAWFAPEYDYMLVQMLKGKDGVEQFQIQMTAQTMKQ
ncbi:DUF3108 domain-containing protein [Pseudoalteromonas luteoviolacea]|uniref:DUF3108 domain-containing protein n=1 Tax=Pseudoalteromonas luteoviolacea S4054 TaxID=1129367 RepID=A0A0F6A3P1_9GAMM|nr:DUF3108 domain-containing protein [Pseudoalteromonas luteoviolacea]KKE80820.1 hypothetical protein N479_03855 [Pseudoalteromonas luteoviolacea S4054]KZN71046.1 hypothetical protein N481_20280 [Pseudoalteromonas luteoviolacea S4047-1]